MTIAHDFVAQLLYNRLPGYARVHVQPHDGHIDWFGLNEDKRLSSGERALMRLGAHLLDIPGMTHSTTFVGDLELVDRSIRVDVLACLDAVVSELVG